MANTFIEGDKVVSKLDKEKIYTFLEYIDERKALCVTSNNSTVELWVANLEKYIPPTPYAGGAY